MGAQMPLLSPREYSCIPAGYSFSLGLVKGDWGPYGFG